MSSPIDALAVLGYHRDEAGEWRYGVFGEPVDYPRRLDALDSLFAMQAERDVRVRQLETGYDSLRTSANRLLSERDAARELVFDVFSQACQVDFDREKNEGIYDHMALSAYEDAQAALIEWGVIREDQCKGR